MNARTSQPAGGLARLRTIHWGWGITALFAIPAAVKVWPTPSIVIGVLALSAGLTYVVRGPVLRAVERRTRGGARTVQLPRPRRIQARTLAAYRALSPTGFEQAIAQLLTHSGCHHAQVSGGAGDLGKDVSARLPDGRLVIVQCKKYAATNKVGSAEMQCFGGTCYAVHRAGLALFVTTSTFTPAARDYATHVGIRLIDGPALIRWANGGRPPWA